jgi:hypothetical protein
MYVLYPKIDSVFIFGGVSVRFVPENRYAKRFDFLFVRFVYKPVTLTSVELFSHSPDNKH